CTRFSRRTIQRRRARSWPARPPTPDRSRAAPSGSSAGSTPVRATSPCASPAATSSRKWTRRRPSSCRGSRDAEAARRGADETALTRCGRVRPLRPAPRSEKEGRGADAYRVKLHFREIAVEMLVDELGREVALGGHALAVAELALERCHAQLSVLVAALGDLVHDQLDQRLEHPRAIAVEVGNLPKLVDLPGVGHDVVHVPQMVEVLAERLLDAPRESRIAGGWARERVACDSGAPARIPALPGLPGVERVFEPDRDGRSERAALAMARDDDLERRAGAALRFGAQE